MKKSMFEVKENECIGFESKWKVKKIYYDNGVQTTGYLQGEKETNTVTKNEIEIQTETEPPKKGGDVAVDMEKLALFLAKVYPRVKKNLDDASTSKAFENYITAFEDESGTEIKILQNFIVQDRDSQHSKDLQVGALSWNSTGKTLAVSCNLSHKTWCLHHGSVNIYTLDNKSDIFPEKPWCVLTTESCVTSLKYHPTQPSIIAAGTYTGDLYAWNTNNKKGGNKFFTKINAHEDVITQLSWINDVDVAKTIILASSSLDGFLNLWNFNSAELGLHAKEKFKFKPPLLGAVGRKNLITEKMADKGVRGVISFDFSPHVNNTFVVGLEGGLVVECSRLGTKKLKGSTLALPISDPVFKYYEALDGEVVSVLFSRHRREIFMSSSVDSAIRIYVRDSDEPAKVIYMKDHWNGGFFVPNDEKLLAGCGLSGHLEIYNILTGKRYKNALLENGDGCNLTQITLNEKRPSLVAVGSAKCDIQLLYIPWSKVASSQGQYV